MAIFKSDINRKLLHISSLLLQYPEVWMKSKLTDIFCNAAVTMSATAAYRKSGMNGYSFVLMWKNPPVYWMFHLVQLKPVCFLEAVMFSGWAKLLGLF